VRGGAGIMLAVRRAMRKRLVPAAAACGAMGRHAWACMASPVLDRVMVSSRVGACLRRARPQGACTHARAPWHARRRARPYQADDTKGALANLLVDCVLIVKPCVHWMLAQDVCD
jgi:hypothetical protein